MARIALRIGVLALFVMALLAGFGLVLASIVAGLAPMTGLAAALAIAGGGLLVVAALLVLLAGKLARAERQRRSARDTMVGLVDLILILAPRRSLHRIEAGISAAVGLAALVALLVHPPRDRNDTRD
jgi:hypothetical protein